MSNLSHAALVAALLGTACTAPSSPDNEESNDALSTTAQLLCASSATSDIAGGEKSQILLTADVTKARTLDKATLSMKQNADLGIQSTKLVAQSTYKPTNPTYTGFDKYNTADDTCGYSILTPAGLATQSETFTVYVQERCAGFFVTAELSCKVTTNGKPPPVSTGELVLGFSSARKAELIKNGYYKSTDFKGNDVVLSSAGTSIDIMNIVPEYDEAPDTLCYRGDSKNVTKILNTMLGNTDGNGDHFLDDSDITLVGAAKTIHVDFGVIGEGGHVGYLLDVPVCK